MFWDFKDFRVSDSRIVDAATEETVSYVELLRRADAATDSIKAARKQLVLLLCDNSIGTLVLYLASLRAGHAVMLLNADTDASLCQNIVNAYTPEQVLSSGNRILELKGYRFDERRNVRRGLPEATRDSDPIHPDLAVLLSTSGSTGSPKMVRLTHTNIESNAASIASYLNITPSEVPITTLPFNYSYGLSVIHSHLLAGASIVLTNQSIVQKEFWELFRRYGCTSMAGVPFTYQTLERLHFGTMTLPKLRTMTQAGGRLSKDLIKSFHMISKSKNFRFFVMYGQTEATARISYVPPDQLEHKIGSIGIAIPSGTISLVQDGKAIVGPNVEGELVYTGPNVMMGYAESRSDLAKNDELKGVLFTGDRGYRDADGYFFVTGRTKRFIKVYGLRINLDEVERMLESFTPHPVACLGDDDNLIVVMEGADNELVERAHAQIINLYHLHHSVVTVLAVPQLAVSSSGKKNYEHIRQELRDTHR